jgi:hypothetical protein
MKIAILAACSSRKKVQPDEPTLARSLEIAEIDTVARRWVERVGRAKKATRASDLYAGRGFQEARLASDEHGGSLYVVSAGLGLREADEFVCSYSLTVAPRDADSIQDRVTPGKTVRGQDWWHHLNQHFKTDSPVSTLINSNPDTLFVVSLPRSYLEMIADDLGGLESAARARVRLIGPRSVDEKILPDWNSNVMPYDDRLDGLDSTIPGTRSDFPQRAARHFLRLIGPRRLSASIADHKALVAESLQNLRYPKHVERPRVSDDELRSLIHELWDETGGKVGASLRVLRDKRQISCEQSRFKRLFWEVGKARDQLV